MATTNKDFIVSQGLKVATGVTFPDSTVQTTAFTGLANANLDGGSASTINFSGNADGGGADE